MIKEIILIILGAYIIVAFYFGVLKKTSLFKFFKKFFKFIILLVIIVAAIYGFMVLK